MKRSCLPLATNKEHVHIHEDAFMHPAYPEPGKRAVYRIVGW